MTRRNLIIGIAVVAALALALAGYGFFRSLTSFPSSEDAGVSFRTVSSSRPEGGTCLNEAGEAGLAKELINPRERVVILAGGDDEMPDDTWTEYSPRFPWQKNINRNTLFDDHCFYRSPTAPAECRGDACVATREVSGYSWIDLSFVDAQDCLPSADAGCSALAVDPGAISVTVTRKCHQIVFDSEIYELVDPAGNRYVMHATETETPDLNAAIPAGWTLARVPLDAPLEILPFGGGDACYHNVLRDNLGQGYHQYVFAGETYP